MAGMMMGGGQPPLDNAQTARQPQGVDPDEQTFTQMVAGLRDHIFGKGEQGIVKAMTEADDPGRVCGEIVFALVQEAAKQASQSGREFDIEMLLGVATEAIDDISELMAAHGVEMTEQEREFALLFAQQLYIETSNPSEDDRAAAKQELARMKETGEVDTAVEYVQQRGTEAGADPFGTEEMPQRPGMMRQGE